MSEPTQEQVDTLEFEQEDIDKNKTMAGLAYLIFFLPLLVCPDSKYAKFHANQALILLIFSVAGGIVLNFVPFGFGLGLLLRSLFSLFTFVLFIIGLVNGFGGKAKELPLIGGFTILK